MLEEIYCTSVKCIVPPSFTPQLLKGSGNHCQLQWATTDLVSTPSQRSSINLREGTGTVTITLVFTKKTPAITQKKKKKLLPKTQITLDFASLRTISLIFHHPQPSEVLQGSCLSRPQISDIQHHFWVEMKTSMTFFVTKRKACFRTLSDYLLDQKNKNTCHEHCCRDGLGI